MSLLREPTGFRRVVVLSALLTSAVFAVLASVVNSGVGAAATTYYVNCNGGNDANPGTSQASAWQSLNRANKASLTPGDQLLLQRGCTFSGPLKASWHGTASQPITISVYGSGAQPKIAHAKTHNVEITGSYLLIEDLQTQHVKGDYTDSFEGNPMGWKLGFNFQDSAHHNTLRRVRTSGHAIGVNFGDNTKHNRVLESVIADNFGLFAKNNAATGILLHGHANEIAYNRFENNKGLTLPHKSVSLEVYNATSSNIHHNTSYDNKFAEIGSGKIVSRDNTFAYNTYTSNYTPASGKKGALFVVTRGQGCNFGPVWNTRLFNNVVYLTGGSSEGVIAGCSSPEVLTMRNNIVVVKNKALYIGGGGMAESHNIFWHSENNPPKYNFVQNWTMDKTSKLTNPKFVDAGKRNFHLKSDSPAINAGSNASVNAGYKHDMDGNNVPAGGAVDIGAYETGGSKSGSTERESPDTADRVALPGRIEAENYTVFHDTTKGNSGKVYRDDDVDIEATSDNAGGYNVGWIDAGEWLAYDVSVDSAGKYRFKVRLASPANNKEFHLEVNGNKLGTVKVPNTGDFQNWTDVVAGTVQLDAGNHTVKLVANKNRFNVNYIDVERH